MAAEGNTDTNVESHELEELEHDSRNHSSIGSSSNTYVEARRRSTDSPANQSSEILPLGQAPTIVTDLAGTSGGTGIEGATGDATNPTQSSAGRTILRGTPQKKDGADEVSHNQTSSMFYIILGKLSRFFGMKTDADGNGTDQDGPNAERQNSDQGNDQEQKTSITKNFLGFFRTNEHSLPNTVDRPLPSHTNVEDVGHGPEFSKFIVKTRRLYRPLGYHKGYNFVFFIIFVCILVGFSGYFYTYFGVGGNSWRSFKLHEGFARFFYYQSGSCNKGLRVHLYTVLPIAIFVPNQFLPFWRKNRPMIHRLIGYFVYFLIMVSNIGSLIIARHACGATLDLVVAVWILVLLIFTGIGLAFYNIRKIQIDQHRIWNLRIMFLQGSIVPAKILQACAERLISKSGNYFQTQTCNQIAYAYGPKPIENVFAKYPACWNASEFTEVTVIANIHGAPEQIGASKHLTFGMALWLAILLTIIAVEIYLALTTDESHRMRCHSFHKQKAAGFENPGSAGLVADTLADGTKWQHGREPCGFGNCTGFEPDGRSIGVPLHQPTGVEVFPRGMV